jgi:hypothetical protein
MYDVFFDSVVEVVQVRALDRITERFPVEHEVGLVIERQIGVSGAQWTTSSGPCGRRKKMSSPSALLEFAIEVGLHQVG